MAEDTSYLHTVVNLGLRSSTTRLKYELGRFFDGVELREKSVLEVGGGKGIYSFGAAYLGATRVVCLEPLGDGSTDTAISSFKQLQWSASGLSDVELVETTLQKYQASERFDVVLLNDSINHLDENACMHLHVDKEAVAIYQALARKLYECTNPGGYLIMCDCSNRNLFGDIGVSNPIASTIEWHKHQAPKTWIRIFSDAGYSNPNVNWTSFNTLGTVGRLLLGNAVAGYLTYSHFRIKMSKGALNKPAPGALTDCAS